MWSQIKSGCLFCFGLDCFFCFGSFYFFCRRRLDPAGEERQKGIGSSCDPIALFFFVGRAGGPAAVVTLPALVMFYFLFCLEYNSESDPGGGEMNRKRHRLPLFGLDMLTEERTRVLNSER